MTQDFRSESQVLPTAEEPFVVVKLIGADTFRIQSRWTFESDACDAANDMPAGVYFVLGFGDEVLEKIGSDGHADFTFMEASNATE